MEGVDKEFCGTHSLRIGGAAALYALCKDVGIVRRFGRWTPDSIMPWLYAWEVISTSRETSRGMSSVVFDLFMHRDAQDRRPWA